MKAIIHKGSWEIPPIFKLIQDSGNVPAEEMYNTFNMGIGMVMALPAEIAPFVVAEANNLKEKAYIIGEVTAGEEKIEIC